MTDFDFYRTQVYLGSDLWVRVSLTDSTFGSIQVKQVIQVIQVIQVLQVLQVLQEYKLYKLYKLYK